MKQKLVDTFKAKDTAGNIYYIQDWRKVLDVGDFENPNATILGQHRYEPKDRRFQCCCIDANTFDLYADAQPIRVTRT